VIGSRDLLLNRLTKGNTMARIVTFAEYGTPEVLRIKEIETPKPGPREIRIRVKAIGLNRAESMWRKGDYVEPVNLPACIGYEASGIVDAIGSDVTRLGENFSDSKDSSDISHGNRSSGKATDRSDD
jgi:hypothetical protein